MRKFSWILALMTALAMVFIACPSEGGGGADWDLPEVTWKYIEILPRSAAWHSIDIRVQNNLTSDFTSGKAHTITVWGAASGGGAGIAFGGAQVAQGDISSPVSADPKNKGRFKLSHTFAWDLLTDIAKDGGRRDIRVNGIAASAPIATFWEVLIVDADGKEIYRLSTDPEIQAMEHNYPVLQEGGNKTKWLVGALGGDVPVEPVGYIKDPGSTSSFVAVTDITGVPTEGMVGIDLTLTGAAQPVGIVTNSTITWELVDAGVTGATVVDGIVKTITAVGTVKVKATVVNGKSATEDFTKEFTITIKEGIAIGDEIFNLADWLDGKDLGAVTGDLADPLIKAGSPTLEIAADGIKILSAPRDYDTFDISLTKMPVPMDIVNQNYKLIVSGKLLTAGATKVRLQVPASPWTTLASQTMTGTVNEEFELEFDIPMDYPNSTIRISYEGDAPYPDVIINSIVLTYEGPRTGLVKYTISFNPDNGEAAPAPIQVTKGVPVGAGVLPTPEKAGFKFVGWFLADNTTEITATTVVTDALDGVTLKAKWVDAASLPAIDEADEDDTLFIPAANWNGGTADKYEFNGKNWWVLHRATAADATAVTSWVTANSEKGATAFDSGVMGGSAALSRIGYKLDSNFKNYDYITITYDLINIMGVAKLMIRANSDNNTSNGSSIGGGAITLDEGTNRTLTISKADFLESKADGEYFNIIYNDDAANQFSLIRITKVVLANQAPLSETADVDDTLFVKSSSAWAGSGWTDTTIEIGGKMYWIVGDYRSGGTETQLISDDDDFEAIKTHHGTGYTRIYFDINGLLGADWKNYTTLTIMYEMIEVSTSGDSSDEGSRGIEWKGNDGSSGGSFAESVSFNRHPWLEAGLESCVLPVSEMSAAGLLSIVKNGSTNSNYGAMLIRIIKVEAAY